MSSQSVDLPTRIRHTDPAQFESEERVHGGVGVVHYQRLLESHGFTTPFMGLYASVLPPGTGLGHHFHHLSEEVYVILDETAEFTVNGRTSVLAGPAGAPCRLRDSHAIYNSAVGPVRLVVFAVSTEPAAYDSWDLGDDRVGADLDSRPVFLHFAVDKSLLVNADHEGVRRRRLIPSSVFSTDWSYLDHVFVDAGCELPEQGGRHLEEALLVIAGEGSVAIKGERAAVQSGDAIPIFLGESYTLAAGDSSPLELLVAGIEARAR